DLVALLELGTECVDSILRRPGAILDDYLVQLSNAYTLLAFLRQTPDVQRALDHMVEGGRIVLDATVVLPMLGETLFSRKRSAISRTSFKLLDRQEYRLKLLTEFLKSLMLT